MFDRFARRHGCISVPCIVEHVCLTVRTTSRTALVLIGAACLLLATVGCGREKAPTADVESVMASPKVLERDHFEIGLDFLRMRDEHNLERSASQASHHFNRWLRDKSADPNWLIDQRMIGTLPGTLRRAATANVLSDKSLAKLEFDPDDVQLLEEARWLNATAKLLERSELDPTSQRWLQDVARSGIAARTLATSLAAFDWTVRNIQLEELLDYPRSAVAGPAVEPGDAGVAANELPPMRAVPGPGYTRTPWEVLLYGRGDAYQRARVFILLLRQLRIDAVMLGIDTKAGRPRAWLPAVLIDKELYLFDPALGLPVAGPRGVGIATLAQARADRSILDSLSIGDNYPYPTSQKDLESVVALIDASPGYMSQRMALIERELSAADQMILTISPSGIAKALRECDGISDVRLWAVPVEAEMYREARAARLANDVEAQREEFLKRGVFQQLNPLVQGRRMYLLGRFLDTEDGEGAVTYWRAARTPDASLERIDSSRKIQKNLGLKQPRGMSDQEWRGRLEQLKELQVQSKQHASYWMGLLHQQQGNYEIAINWLETRSLEKSPDGPWVDGARYNLARCHEALGRADQAITLYRIDESPQRHGNLLRALRLEQQAAPTGPKAELEESEETETEAGNKAQ